MSRVKDVMEQMRQGGYGANKPSSVPDISNASRAISLTAEERKMLPEPDENGEVCVVVYGKPSKEGLEVTRIETEQEDTQGE